MDKPKIAAKSWREDISRVGIQYMDDPRRVLELVSNHDVLICSRCSRTKGDKTDKAVPKNFYVSKTNLQFYKWCEELNIKYGILSDLYGLHLWDKKKKFYDIHPSSLSQKQFKKLAKKIKKIMCKNRWSTFLYWNASPIMSAPYFYMMLLTGFKIYYITKLPKLDNLNPLF